MSAKRKLVRDRKYHFLYREMNSKRWIVRAHHDKRSIFESTGESVSYERAVERAKEIYGRFLGEKPAPERIAFKHVGAEVIDTKRGLAKATLTSAEIHIEKHLNLFFGEMLLRNIDEATWAAYVTRERAADPTRKLFNDWKHFRMVMLRAFNRGIIPRKIMVKNPDPMEDSGREFTDNDISKLLEHASDSLRAKILIALFMGMRVNEILGLRWDRIDLENAQLEAWDKKRRRWRSIQINERYVLPALKERKLKSKSDYVFPSRYDLSVPTNSIKTSWKFCKINAGVRGKFHWLRHTCASKRARAGMPPALIQSDLGMSPRVMNRIYLHLTKEDRKRMANSFDLPSKVSVQNCAATENIDDNKAKK